MPNRPRLNISLFSAGSIERRIPIEGVREPSYSSRSSRWRPRVLATRISLGATRFFASEIGYEDAPVHLLVPAKVVGSILPKPLWMLNDPLSRTIVTRAKIAIRAIRDVSKTTSSTLDKSLMKYSWRLVDLLCCDCLPVAVGCIVCLWRDQCRDIPAQSTRGFDFGGTGIFLFSYYRNLNSVIDFLGRLNGCRIVK